MDWRALQIRDMERINAAADDLNAEAMDVLTYQHRSCSYVPGLGFMLLPARGAHVYEKRRTLSRRKPIQRSQAAARVWP